MGLLPQQTPSTLKKDQPLYHSDNEYQLTQQHKVHQNSYPENQKSKSHIFLLTLILNRKLVIRLYESSHYLLLR